MGINIKRNFLVYQISKKLICDSLILVLLITNSFSNAFAAQVLNTIVQPIGTVVEMWDPALVNIYLAKWDHNIIPGVTDPFDTRFPVSEVQPTKAMYFARVFTGSNNNALGSYIFRASVIRGLTPEQIRDVLALPEVPNKVVYVKVPAGAKYGLWTGICGRIFSPGHEWGEGGGEQTKIIGQHTDPTPPADPARFANYDRLPEISYVNAQLIGNKALSYAEAVKQGNGGKMATYLDQHLPEPYSDMEMVYTTLDYISADGPKELGLALEQMSPVNFDTYSTVLFRNDLLFERNLFNHKVRAQALNQCCTSWANIAGEHGQQTAGSNRVGFYYQTGTLMSGTDCQILPNTRIGIGAGYFRDHIGWNASGGNADLNNIKIGVYANYFLSDFFLNSAFTGGFNWGSAQRHLNFSGLGIAVRNGQVVDVLSVDRTAKSNQTGQNLSLYLLGGKNIRFDDWILMPTSQISYFYGRQAPFTEGGAEDLNLHVDAFTAETIRTELALLLGKLFCLQQNIFYANVKLGWAHNFYLDNRGITSSFPVLGGKLTVNGASDETNEVLLSANISTNIYKKMWIDAQYNSYLSHGFTSQSLSLIFKYTLDV